MKPLCPSAAFSYLVFLSAALGQTTLPAANEPLLEWIDADTGHRVVRLSREPGSASLYFHQNAYTAEGDKLIITTPGGVSTINLKTRAIDQVVEGQARAIVVGRKSRQVYYTRTNTVLATHLDTHVTRRIGAVPRGGLASLNADETLLLGSYAEGDDGRNLLREFTADQQNIDANRNAPMQAGGIGRGNQQQPMTGPDGKPLTYAERKEVMLNNTLERWTPRVMFTLDTRNGEIKTVLRDTNWLNHLQFSPTDPNLIMFCHEGPWHKVDRIWTIRTDGSGMTKIHTRTMNMEIAGHEFFAADGRTIWYDLQIPRGEDFWLAGYELATRQRTWYHLQRDEWSVHFNVSPDGTMFAGDGGDSEMVAHAPDGKWIYLFRPQTVPDVAGIKNPHASELIKPGFFKSERLVNMSKHDYRLEPNVTFSPDMKWIIFRSNIFGPTHVFAVEIAKAK